MKKTLCSFIYTVFCLVLLLNVNITYAHEIFYNGSTPIILKWNHVSGSTLNVITNTHLLNSTFTTQYSAIKNAWTNALSNESTQVVVTDGTISNSNIDLAIPTQEYWYNRFGILNYRRFLGICDATSTDGILLNSASAATSSSKKIYYAGIFINPYDVFDNTNAIRFTMVHEIGHAFGLGHPNDTYYPTTEDSVMRTHGVPNYYEPQNHDVIDMINKY